MLEFGRLLVWRGFKWWRCAYVCLSVAIINA